MEEKEFSKLLGDAPILDITSPNFKDELAFNIWSSQSCSDYRNDRKRPYDGQPHTDDGIRGMVEIRGLTMRDIKDCFVKAFLQCCIPSQDSKDKTKRHEYWVRWSELHDEDGNPTKELINRQEEFPWIKVDLGTWKQQDMFNENLDQDFDPVAVSQALTCEIEKMMGIYPNVPTLISHDDEGR